MMCTGCDHTLRVGDEHAGKKARCPNCGTIVSVPSAGAAPSTPATEDPFGGETEHVAEPAKPIADLQEPSSNPYESPRDPVGVTPFGHLKPHRGGMVLTFGILGLLCCGPLGIVAWVMGASDLREIREGKMDPSGRGLTQGGMILGIIASVILILGAVVQVLMLVARAS
jgi:hypothetical protein